MNKDLTIVDDKNMLNVRVAGIIIKDNRVLMVKNLRSDYIYSLGGRLKFGESARQGVVREVEEETGVRLEIDRLGFVFENIFIGHTPSKMDKLVYEITFYFYMKVPEDFHVETGIETADDERETLVWIDWHSDEEYYPLFFRTELDNPSQEVKHIFIDERQLKI
ncbi:MAG: NUDIX domain-containing protein [Oscillospiraceae bacterium]|nr:NUDIX domain-containing protein [Oscillospiraceae bacterium]